MNIIAGVLVIKFKNWVGFMKKMKVKFLFRQVGGQVQRMRNILAILALFVCTSICLGQQTINITTDITTDSDKRNVYGNGDAVTGRENGSNGYVDKAPRDNIVNIIEKAEGIGHVYGAYMNDSTVGADGSPIFGPMTGNRVNVFELKTEDQEFTFVSKKIYGAYSERTTAVEVNDNAVEIKLNVDFSIRGVYGGYACKGTVSSNTVTISSGVTTERYVTGNVYGGYIVKNGTAILNKVHLTDVHVMKNVYGAYIEKKEDADETYGYASSNTVTITGGIVNENVFGGCTKKGIVSSNTVTISSSVKIGQNVYGGYIVKNGTATGNTVKLTDVGVGLDVFGAKIGGDGLASSNTVTIISGAVQNVFGGRTEKGTVSSNTVTISSSVKIEQNVYGAYIGKEGGPDETYGYASSNTVTIISGTVQNVFGGYIVKNGTATLNKVNLTDVGVGLDVFGAKIGGDGLASSNTVIITSGAVQNVYGGHTKNGTVSSNTVRIERGEIKKHVYGGYIYQSGTATLNTVDMYAINVINDVAGAKIENGSGYASSNTVTIERGEIKEHVYGGYIFNVGTATLNTVNLTDVDVKQNVYGAKIENGSGLASSNTVTIERGKIKGHVYGGYIFNVGTATLNKVHLTDVDVKKNVFGARIRYGLASSNTVTIKGGAVKSVFGGYILLTGTATGNTVNLTSVAVSSDVFGAWIRGGLNGDGDGDGDGDETNELASSNTVTVTGGKMERNVYGGFIIENGTAIENKVNMTSVTVSGNVCGAKIKNGLARDNKVRIDGNGKMEGNVYGGYVSTGTASSNTVTINGGKIEGNVFGGFVKGNGKATHNTINITGSVEFSTTTILCGGICANKATADASTNDAFTGNTLNIVETKGVVVNGISNFENYNFHLKDIKPGEVILTATSGGCSWDVGMFQYTTACAVDLSSSNIHLRTQSVLNKGEYCTLIKSPQGFKDNIPCKKFDFDNGGLVEYSWEIKIADNKQDLIATLKRKELREEKAKPLLEGNVTGMVCINNGMDCIISKMEETESVLGEGAKLQRKGEIGAFYGLLANKSSYDDTGSHIDMTGMSMMGGIGIGWKGLVTGAFGECGTGNSDIDSGLCHCEKKSEGKSNYVGGGLLGRYNVCEDEFRGTKLYLEAILRAGEVSNTFNSKEAKDGAEKECKYNDETTMYGGCALGGGYKHKVSEKMDVDWSLRYMFGYQDGKDVEKPVDADGNRVKLESVKSSRIRVGVRGKYVELEKVKPYIGIWYEHELSGEVKGAIQNGVDNVGDIPATSFEGGTGIGELGISVKVGKLDVGISGQGYLGVRKGFGGMLKLKYAFGKDAHAKPQPKDYEKETVELERVSDPKDAYAKPQPKDKKKETTESEGRRSLNKLLRKSSKIN